MKVLLDTNIILDHILSYDPHAEAIGKIFALICQDEIEAAVTANSITDIYYIISKRLGSMKAREALRNLLDVLAVVGVDGNDCISALDLPISDFEDAVVVACAGKSNIDYIVTNDKEFLQVHKELAQTVTPDELLSLIPISR